MSELPAGVAPAVEAVPRDSASGIVLRRGAGGALEVLLGRRAERARFMPGHLVFPGGLVEAGDRGGPDAFRRCVSRETREETGLAIPESGWHEAGERVTPPLSALRYRTRFWVAESPRAVPGPEAASDELQAVEFRAPGAVVADWEAGRERVPPPTLPILRALDTCGAAAPHEVAALLLRVNAEEEAAPRIEFVPGIWMLPVRTATLPPATHTNVWLPGGGRLAVVDPGSSEGPEVERLLATIERRARAGCAPHVVVLTHRHRDHTSGAVAIAAALGVGIAAHPGVLERLDRPSGIAARPLADGDTIDLDGLTLRALHTPGHAPDHLAFHVPEAGATIAGDLVSGVSTILVDPEHGDMAEYLASLRRATALEPRLVLPGHGPPLPGRALERALAHREERERKILAELAGAPRELAAIAAAAYADTPDGPPRLAELQALSHLRALERAGRAGRDAHGRWAAESPARARLATIESRLRERFRPTLLELHDDSAKHAGHPGAASGGGHYRLRIVAEAFAGRTPLERHRMVHDALRELFGREIHALSIRALGPDRP